MFNTFALIISSEADLPSITYSNFCLFIFCRNLIMMNWNHQGSQSLTQMDKETSKNRHPSMFSLSSNSQLGPEDGLMGQGTKHVPAQHCRLCFLECISIFNWTDHHCIKEMKTKLNHPGKRAQNFSFHDFSSDSFQHEARILWLPGLTMAQIQDCTVAKNQMGEDLCTFIFWNTHNLETSLGYVCLLYRASSQRSSSIDE